jgi:hypothetical protein
MKPEAIEQVLMEVLEELKTLKGQKEKEGKILEELCQTVKSFEEKLSTMKVTALPTDLSSVEQQLKKGIIGLQTIMEEKPKNITRDFNFHLFPKLNIKEYYQTYSKLVFYLTIFLLAAGLVNIGVEWIQGYNRRQEEVPRFHGIEYYKESAAQPEPKKVKRKTALVALDTLKQKLPTGVPIPIKDMKNKKQLMDSLRKRMQEYLTRHSTDTLN